MQSVSFVLLHWASVLEGGHGAKADSGT